MALTERKVPRPRGQGQWALGYHEPLNGAEQIKKEAEPLEVRERIERIFAPGGFRSIGKQDLPASGRGAPSPRSSRTSSS
jgi:sulfite reductase (ferredoxin)